MTIKFNTDGYGGRKVTKTIWVETNEPNDVKHKLTLSGEVEKFAEILPKGQVRLIGDADSEIKRTVTIIPEKKYPFKIKDVTAQKGKDIKFELTEKKPGLNGDTGYVLTVENLKKTEGRYFDTLLLKTTSTVRPEISIRVFGDIRKKKEQSEPAS